MLASSRLPSRAGIIPACNTLLSCCVAVHTVRMWHMYIYTSVVAGGKQRILSEEGVRAKLASIMQYHVVRPVPSYEAFTDRKSVV